MMNSNVLRKILINNMDKALNGAINGLASEISDAETP